MSTRVYWRRAHPVRLPDKINTPPHLELLAAYRRDQAMAEIERELAAALEWDFRQEPR
ncbi:hypothetical protein [Mesorhizobium sp. URHB0026]